ncbi:hypothetical protein EI171_06470 [Bradyrhizobium sp. LCT2]|nr:hypothetical protein EI171_06470 [Bradyrhizobium sp. LCT2]
MSAIAAKRIGILSCPGRSAALLQRCAAEPGPMLRHSGSRLCGASLARCALSGTRQLMQEACR